MERPPGPVALTYGDVPGEYQAGLSGAALFDATDRGLVLATGGDAQTFLHRILANDVRTLSPGRGNANLLLSPKGKVLFGFDLSVDADGIRLSTESGMAAALLTALDVYHFSEDVAFTDATEQSAPLELCGEQSLALLETLVGELGQLADHDQLALDWRGERLRITALEVAGSRGVRLDPGPGGAAKLWKALVAAGATPAGLAARDILRVEAGRAAFGVDVTDDVYPQEARLEGAFSLDKGCYIGQEVVAKIDTYGGLNKRLMLLRVSHDDPIATGSGLFSRERELTDGERRLGIVTSWAYSFALDAGVVLAYVKRKHQDVGRVFRIGDADAVATIVRAPVRSAVHDGVPGASST